MGHPPAVLEWPASRPQRPLRDLAPVSTAQLVLERSVCSIGRGLHCDKLIIDKVASPLPQVTLPESTVKVENEAPLACTVLHHSVHRQEAIDEVEVGILPILEHEKSLRRLHIAQVADRARGQLTCQLFSYTL